METTVSVLVISPQARLYYVLIYLSRFAPIDVLVLFIIPADVREKSQKNGFWFDESPARYSSQSMSSSLIS